ncbi:MAG TPA: RedB protein [Thermoanaerobaculia bacterium]|nr:RedB protein [Thermoanaerobaculia bacterium]
MPDKRRNAALWAAAIVWLAGIAYGSAAMWQFQRKAGENAAAPVYWPQQSRLSLAKSGPTVVMFAHPRCPCTRASVSQLRELLSGSLKTAGSVYVLVLRPHEFPAGWERTDIWRNAASIPGVTVLSDVDGVEATRLGALTSGQTLVYDTAGKLVFRGGITALRGEAGDSIGSRSLAAALAGNVPARGVTAVFGCPIRTPEAAPVVRPDAAGRQRKS